MDVAVVARIDPRGNAARRRPARRRAAVKEAPRPTFLDPSRSELQSGGGAPPSVSEGLLGFLIEAVVVKAAHKQRVTEGASSGCKEQ